eukprot:CAMPEP_0196576578 /NCGR_PEP_ID=MMETSP1081-20130531/5798_1 /TAXON_ID=36882 /ORGANISM="Pyramimonas amylifera, Strain CCMP720" /LENGTH=182 /DNA_ID=CAMNT_0041895219 /DNA_START=24 /DNA_END=572 /DNA_ORIENTATION=-
MVSSGGVANVPHGTFRGTEAHSRALMECDFVALMKRLTDLAEHEIYDLHDLLDTGSIGAVALRELCLVLALLSAQDSTERLHVLHMLGLELYNLTDRYQRGWQALRLLGLLLQVQEGALWQTRVAMQVPLGEMLTFQEFQVLFFAAIREDSKMSSVNLKHMKNNDEKLKSYRSKMSQLCTLQ